MFFWVDTDVFLGYQEVRQCFWTYSRLTTTVLRRCDLGATIQLSATPAKGLYLSSSQMSFDVLRFLRYQMFGISTQGRATTWLLATVLAAAVL
jgi:hypothetical protein